MKRISLKKFFSISFILAIFAVGYFLIPQTNANAQCTGDGCGNPNPRPPPPPPTICIGTGKGLLLGSSAYRPCVTVTPATVPTKQTPTTLVCGSGGIGLGRFLGSSTCVTPTPAPTATVRPTIAATSTGSTVVVCGSSGLNGRFISSAVNCVTPTPIGTRR